MQSRNNSLTLKSWQDVRSDVINTAIINQSLFLAIFLLLNNAILDVLINASDFNTFNIGKPCLCQGFYEIGQGVDIIDIVAGFEVIDKFEAAAVVIFDYFFGPF